MPQPDLFKPAHEPMSLRITWTDRTPLLDGSFDVTVELQRSDGEFYTLIAQRWTGVMLDFVTTFTTNVTEAWLYGDRPNVLRAAVLCHRAAKAHARAHERL